MSNITYYVSIAFDRNEEGELVALEPQESQTSSAAVGRARLLAKSKAGAIAFSRTGDPSIGEFAEAVVLFRAGDVLDDALAS
jgi:hypothetical protein